MLFLTLALFGQSAGLDANVGKAARQCMAPYALEIVRNKVNRLRGVSQLTYLAMLTARSEGLAGRPFLVRTNAIIDEEDTKLRSGNIDKTVTLTACDQRFPLARTTAPTPLPKDPIDRDMLCFGMIALFSKVVATAKGNDAELARAEFMSFLTRFEPNMDALFDLGRLNRSNIESNEEVFGDVLRASLDNGNPEATYERCRALPS